MQQQSNRNGDSVKVQHTFTITDEYGVTVKKDSVEYHRIEYVDLTALDCEEMA